MHYFYSRELDHLKQCFHIVLARLFLLPLLGLLGCVHAAPVTEGNASALRQELRPIDIDVTLSEKIGREALEKIGYAEIIKLAEQAGFVAYKTSVRIQLASYGSEFSSGFVPVFSRYAAAAAVTSQADSPLPGPADIAAIGVVVVGLVDAGLLDGYLLDTLGGWLFSKAKDGASGAMIAGAAAASEAVAAENAAYEEARSGGRHAGTLKNYAGRSKDEIEKAIGSYERQVELHKQKIANPEQFAERWSQMGTQEQAGLLNKWRADAARNQQLAEVLRGLLKSK